MSITDYDIIYDKGRIKKVLEEEVPLINFETTSYTQDELEHIYLRPLNVNQEILVIRKVKGVNTYIPVHETYKEMVRRYMNIWAYGGSPGDQEVFNILTGDYPKEEDMEDLIEIIFDLFEQIPDSEEETEQLTSLLFTITY